MQNLGISGFDAIHVASAEIGKADIFLTTDDRLNRKVVRLGEEIQVKASNPVPWLANIFQQEQTNA